MVENAHKYDAAATKLKFRVTANQMVQEKIKGMEQLARAATEQACWRRPAARSR